MSVDLKVRILELQKATKNKQVMNRVKSLQSKIVFFQETHLIHKEKLKVRRRWKGKILSAPFTSQARGVMILIHDSIPFQIHNAIKDKAGRYLIIQRQFLGNN